MLQFTKRKQGLKDSSISSNSENKNEKKLLVKGLSASVPNDLLLVDQDESELWLNKHRPTSVKDLAMHSSRVIIVSIVIATLN